MDHGSEQAEAIERLSIAYLSVHFDRREGLTEQAWEPSRERAPHKRFAVQTCSQLVQVAGMRENRDAEASFEFRRVAGVIVVPVSEQDHANLGGIDAASLNHPHELPERSWWPRVNEDRTFGDHEVRVHIGEA